MSAMAVLTTAADEREAQLIAALVKSEGIPAFVEGSSLMDEWAVCQRLVGQIGVEVKVPEESLSAAAKVLERVRHEGAEHLVPDEADALEVEAEEEEEIVPWDPEDDGSAFDGLLLLLGLFASGLVVFFCVYLDVFDLW